MQVLRGRQMCEGDLRVAEWILNELLYVLTYCINAAEVSIADSSWLCNAGTQPTSQMQKIQIASQSTPARTESCRKTRQQKRPAVFQSGNK